MEIVVASGKGGVGKSLISSNLIRILGEEFRIAGVDADADAPNLHIIFNINRWDFEKNLSGAKVAVVDFSKCIKCGLCRNVCVYDALEWKDFPVIKEYICEGCYACGVICPTKAISLKDVESGVVRYVATQFGYIISAELEVGRPNSGKLVSEEKNIARKFLDEKKVDHIIIDSAAGIGCQVIASLSSADIAILVAEPTKASLSDLMRVHSVVEHFGIKSYIILNKYGMGGSPEIIERFAREKGIEIIGKIPYDSTVPKSLSARKPLVDLYPQSKATKKIREIVEAVRNFI